MIQAEWDSPAQRFMYFTFSGRWTWEESGAAIAHARELAADVEHPFYMVIHFIDETARSHVPTNVFSHATITHRVSPHVTRTIIVNSNSIGVGIMSIMFRLYPRLKEYYVFAPTLEDAERLMTQECGQK